MDLSKELILETIASTYWKQELNRPGKKQSIQESGEVQPEFNCSFGHFFQILEPHSDIVSPKMFQICIGCLE
jgi:hypothetical protein